MSEYLTARVCRTLIGVLLENQVERESLEAILQASGAVDPARLETMRSALRQQLGAEIAGLEAVDTVEKLDYYLARFSSLRGMPKA
jgi:hypothetical protein